MKRGAITADEARASNLFTLQAMVKGLQHTRQPNFPKLLFRGKGSSEGPEPEVLYALLFDDVIAFVPPPPLRPMTHIFGGRRGHLLSVLHSSSSSLNSHLHGLTVVGGSKEEEKQQQHQKILRDAGGSMDVSAFSDDFQQYFQASFMSADVLRLITHWYVTRAWLETPRPSKCVACFTCCRLQVRYQLRSAGGQSCIREGSTQRHLAAAAAPHRHLQPLDHVRLPRDYRHAGASHRPRSLVQCAHVNACAVSVACVGL